MRQGFSLGTSGTAVVGSTVTLSLKTVLPDEGGITLKNAAVPYVLFLSRQTVFALLGSWSQTRYLEIRDHHFQ